MSFDEDDEAAGDIHIAFSKLCGAISADQDLPPLEHMAKAVERLDDQISILARVCGYDETNAAERKDPTFEDYKTRALADRVHDLVTKMFDLVEKVSALESPAAASGKKPRRTR